MRKHKCFACKSWGNSFMEQIPLCALCFQRFKRSWLQPEFNALKKKWEKK